MEMIKNEKKAENKAVRKSLSVNTRLKRKVFFQLEEYVYELL